MLDQNTDRMWFVIGAVIVGAAIIFIANGTLPDVFASITSTFEDTSEQALGVVSDIAPKGINLIHGAKVHEERWVNENDGVLQTNNNAHWHSAVDYMPVEPGQKYVFRTSSITRNKRVAYYREDKSYITGSLKNGQHIEFVTEAPDDAAYARISTRYITELGLPVSSWFFGLD